MQTQVSNVQSAQHRNIGLFFSRGNASAGPAPAEKVAPAKKPSAAKKQQVKYTTPGGEYDGMYIHMLSQSHLLIAGTTGSGKSVLLNGLIYTALRKSPLEVKFMLIDPKRTELSMYKPLDHTIRYASEPDDMAKALEEALNIIEKRFKKMSEKHLKTYNGSDVYVIIDELADLMTTDRKRVTPLIQRICQIGRAAKVHVIACTQCPLAKILPTEIKVNFDARVGLRTKTAQDSRNILDMKGCEDLPQYGKCIYSNPERTSCEPVLYYSDEELESMVTWWLTDGRQIVK